MPLQPTGTCWCGCGEATGPNSFFLPGHDKLAEAAVILVKYGGVPEFLDFHGYSPTGNPGGNNARRALAEWRQRGHSAR